jgi:carbonic anhydrase
MMTRFSSSSMLRLVFSLVLDGRVLATNFSYDSWTNDGPLFWGKSFPDCSGLRQSPIDIQWENVRDGSSLIFKWNLIGYESLLTDYNITNNGHTVKIEIGQSQAGRYKIESKGLSFDLQQLHFHWGRNLREGSEHTIEGAHYPLEMHLVHRRSHSSVSEALHKRRGVAVLAVLFDAGPENAALEKVLEVSQQVNCQGKPKQMSGDVSALNISALMPEDLGKIFQYDGSFTTPPCSEVALWSIFRQSSKASLKQLEYFSKSFQKLSHSNKFIPLSHNFRATQTLNGRLIYCV